MCAFNNNRNSYCYLNRRKLIFNYNSLSHRQIEIYENYVQELYSIIFELIHHLNSKPITPEQAVASQACKVTDLKQEEESITVINAMDFKP